MCTEAQMYMAKLNKINRILGKINYIIDSDMKDEMEELQFDIHHVAHPDPEDAINMEYMHERAIMVRDDFYNLEFTYKSIVELIKELEKEIDAEEKPCQRLP